MAAVIGDALAEMDLHVLASIGVELDPDLTNEVLKARCLPEIQAELLRGPSWTRYAPRERGDPMPPVQAADRAGDGGNLPGDEVTNDYKVDAELGRTLRTIAIQLKATGRITVENECGSITVRIKSPLDRRVVRKGK